MDYRWLGSFVLAGLTAGSATAADIPVKGPRIAPPAYYNWSGLYVGGHAGYIWSSSRIEDNGIVVEPHAATNGFVGGALAGVNVQSGNWVYGLEGDFGWSNARGTGTFELPPNRYELEWTSHLRGRLGVTAGPQGQWLFFIAGGAAFTRSTFIDGGTLERTSATYTGGSIGVGADYAFGNQVFGRVEYIYDNFHMGASLNRLNDYTAKLQDSSTVRAAIGFKFN